jgi:PhzF family phenazine biosynthesis protein
MESGPGARPILGRLAAFTTNPAGGNPAGVWVGDRLPDPNEMQRIAARIGYSETAFLAAAGSGRWDTRYFSPEAEVSFCGHATIATGVLLGELEGEGAYTLATTVGDVPVAVERVGDRFEASLTSVEPRQAVVPSELLNEALAALGWRPDILDSGIPPALAYAGAWHLVMAVGEHVTLNRLEYDYERLKRAMLGAGLTTLQLIWRERESLYHSRNPARFSIRQGEAMGRPSRIEVEVPARGGIVVRGTAVPIGGESP